MTTRRPLTAIISALALLLLLPATAFADSHWEIRDLTIEPSTVAPGDSFAVSGQCTEESGGQELTVLGTDPGGGQLGTVTANADGSFSGQADVSENSPAGDLEVSVPCAPESNILVRGTLTITDGSGETPVGGVETGFGGAATTGGPLALLVAALGLALIAGGTLARRSRA
jgi:hypothetical protein